MKNEDFISGVKFYQTAANFWGQKNDSSDNTPALASYLSYLASQSMSLEELDKQLTNLKAVESWLNLNASLLRTCIQSIELQRSTITAVKHFNDNVMTVKCESAENQATISNTPVATIKNLDLQNLDYANAWWKILEQQFTEITKVAMGPISDLTASMQNFNKKTQNCDEHHNNPVAEKTSINHK